MTLGKFAQLLIIAGQRYNTTTTLISCEQKYVTIDIAIVYFIIHFCGNVSVGFSKATVLILNYVIHSYHRYSYDILVTV